MERKEWVGNTEVKTAILGVQNSWKFLLHKHRGKVTRYLVICKTKDKQIKYIFLIPDVAITKNNLVISEKNIGKYLKYTI